jgi:Zn-dependent peptidase ImmA (M78 family)/transcriptional regulator with XRE-family HTH domain
MQEQSETFFGERLTLARDFKNLTQKDLGNRVATSGATISYYETGKKKNPSPELVAAFADVLEVEPEFFFAPIADLFREEECSFRHRRSATEKTKSHVRAHGTLLGMVVGELRAHFHFPVVDVPHHPVNSEADIEVAAEQTRLHWQLGIDAPILQVGRALERAGIFIARHVVQTPKVDAFSRPGETTIVFLNETVKSTSRWNFDLGHETGHLVMHRGIQTGDVETESQADRFASAFLMPRRPFAREFQAAPFSWPHIFALKRRWHTSLAAIVRRSYDLNLIGAAQYRRAYQYMSFKGWTKGEPAEPPFQEPELLATAFAALGSRVDLTAYQLCQRLHFTAETFKAVTGLECHPPAAKLSNVIPMIRPK